MNFVPKNPIESALAEMLAEIGAPAWIIDVERGVVAGSNGRGVAVWGVPALAPALDSVVPARRVLHQVRRRVEAPHIRHAVLLQRGRGRATGGADVEDAAAAVQ